MDHDALVLNEEHEELILLYQRILDDNKNKYAEFQPFKIISDRGVHLLLDTKSLPENWNFIKFALNPS